MPVSAVRSVKIGLLETGVSAAGAEEPVQSFLVFTKLEQDIAALIAKQHVLGLTQEFLVNVVQSSELPFLVLNPSLNLPSFLIAVQLVKNLHHFLIRHSVVGIDGLSFLEPSQSFLRPILFNSKLAIEPIGADAIGMKLDQSI